MGVPRGENELNSAMIDRKLDRYLHVKIVQHNGIFELLKLHPTRLDIYFMDEPDVTTLQIYIPKTYTDTGHLSILRYRDNIVDIGDFFSIEENIQPYESFKVIINIMKIPSVIISDSYLVGNESHFIFKFHSIFSRDVTETLASSVVEDENVSIIEIRLPGRYRDEIMSINSMKPLVVFQSSSIFPSENGTLFEVGRRYPETITEVEPRSLTVNGVRAISYAKERLDVEGLKIISKEDHIYETRQLESVMMKRRKELNRQRIPRIATILDLRGNRIFNTTILPKAYAKIHLKTYLKTDFQYKQFEPKIELYSEISDTVWDYIFLERD